MQQGQDLTGDQRRAVLERMREVLSAGQPDIVACPTADTTTTFAGATLPPFYAKIPVRHVEAVLAPHTTAGSPFPEGDDRSLVGRIATLHFASTANNAHNLEREAVEGDLFVTGNHVIRRHGLTPSRGEQFCLGRATSRSIFSRRGVIP